ncbi:multiprotein-bridging factor 1 family protein [Brevibacillus sp. TJ4]|uniref:helix-turn-helix domain-containing protein n=1 Tax=Brevibacillus sp. TJ4 TaxID=3234853 RepID=UPI0037D5D014
MDYGPLLKTMRVRAGLSQDQLAEKLHRTGSCISKFESGKKVPDMNTFMAWVHATGTMEVAVAVLCGMDGISIMQQLLGMMFAFWLI